MKYLAFLLLAVPALGAAQTICIDPGHPSEVGVGTRGKRATEVQVAWDMAVALRNRLRQAGFATVLTKQSLNQKVLNRQRAEVANRSQATLMVRLHCDAAAGTGFTVYYPSQAGKSAGVTGPSAEVIARSREAATRFHVAMANRLRGTHKDNGLKTDLQTAVGARQGALTGSVFSKVPVLLVEMVVLTNPKDEAFITSKAGRAKMVEALADGVIAAVRRQEG
jgi:N-acetylmuramoyl-L-alanine amidase